MARNVAVFVGSLRRESFTKKIANALAELAPPSLHLEQIEIGGLPHYNQDLDGESPPPEWRAFRDRVRGADAVLFATPEYNRGVPGVLKNAIDVGSRPYGKSVWVKKPGAVISVSPGVIGAFGANHALRQSMVFLDVPMMQQPEAYISRVDALLDRDGKLADASTRDFLTKYLAALAAWIERNVVARS